MKLSNLLFAAAFAGQTLATWGFGKSAYNKWHETELERWLSDHDIDYPKPADRKELEKIVQDNWQTKVVDSYKSWDPRQLHGYLKDTGKEIDHKQKEDTNWLVQQVKSGWHETEKTAETAFESVKDWIFDSWTESQLKAFLDRHGIPNPTPRTHDTLVAEVRKNYANVAEKLGESSSYPGNWLYESWSESDLKRWLDERGYPVPQPTTRDKLIASVRRNSRLASVKAKKSKDSTKKTISDSIFDTWSESKLKEFLDKNNVRVPQGSTKNELLALARRNKAYLSTDSAYNATAGVYNSAKDAAAEKVAQATDTASSYGQNAFDKIIEQWSDTRLKAYLDSRGVPCPQASKRDELLAKVRLHKHKAASGYGAWTFDTWTYDNLKNWLEERGQKVSDSANSSRAELLATAQAYYDSVASSAAAATETASASAGSAGSKVTDAAAGAGSKVTDAAAGAASKVGEAASKVGEAASQATDSAANAGTKVKDTVADSAKAAYASVSASLAKTTDTAKDTTFNTWSDSDLKAYLDSYGIKTYQGSTRNELIAMARRNAHYFRYGSQDQGINGYLTSTLKHAKDYVMSILGMGTQKIQDAGNKVHEKAKATKDEAQTRAEKAYAGAKNEL